MQREHERLARERKMEEEIAKAVSAATMGTTPGASPGGGQIGGGDAALVSKWAPNSFSGKEDEWRSWSTKFRSFVGAMKGGAIGTWMDWVKEHRGDSCKAGVLDHTAKPCAAMLHSSLIATCEGKAMAIVEKAGAGEGLEA